jgi:hypothetical protein
MCPMRIVLTRTGGFAGTRARVEVDTASLSAGDAQRLRALVAAADVASSPPSTVRDEFAYDLEIDDEGRLRSCRIGDSAMSERTRALVDWLLARAGRA